jgi:hypothetical protein
MSITTTKGLVSTLVTDLRTLFASSPDCVVEAYWRTETPKVLTACVVPMHQAGEHSAYMGNNFQDGWLVNVYVEKPWDNKTTTAEAVLDVAEALYVWASSNREYVTNYVTTVGRTSYVLINRPGRGDPTFCAIVPLQFDPPRV